MVEAKVLSRYCQTQAVRQIQRPFSDGSHVGSFTFRYGLSTPEIDGSFNPETPLIIFVPGGPGQSSMDQGLSYPDGFSIVRTDPRGVGCNENEDLIPLETTSEDIARDLLAIVQDLKPRHYIIHAISYGTIPATILALLIEEKGLPRPQALVLEGTIGRAFLPNEYALGTLSSWREVRSSLSQRGQEKLRRNQFPFHLTSKEFAAWIATALSFGRLPINEKSWIIENLEMALSDGDESAKQGLEALTRYIVKPPSQEHSVLYKKIACHEIAADVRDVKFDYDFKNGDIFTTENRLCENVTLDHPYDSARYASNIPVFYFSGDHDSVTPSNQAEYHFRKRKKDASLIQVLDGGHAALSMGLSDCSSKVWEGLAHEVGISFSERENPISLEAALRACGLKTFVKRK